MTSIKDLYKLPRGVEMCREYNFSNGIPLIVYCYHDYAYSDCSACYIFKKLAKRTEDQLKSLLNYSNIKCIGQDENTFIIQFDSKNKYTLSNINTKDKHYILYFEFYDQDQYRFKYSYTNKLCIMCPINKFNNLLDTDIETVIAKYVMLDLIDMFK